MDIGKKDVCIIILESSLIMAMPASYLTRL